MDDRGWGSRDSQLEHQLLDWVYAETQGNSVPAIGNFLEGREGTSAQAVTETADILEGEGLIHITRVLAGTLASHATPTADGVAVVRRIRSQRADPKHRARACREAILDWLYTQKRAGEGAAGMEDFLVDPRASFWGQPFSEREMGAATSYLLDRGLVNGVSAWGGHLIRPEITSQGEEVVEDYDGSLAEFSAASRSGGTQIHTHFSGTISNSQVGVGSNVAQTQHIGLDSEELLPLLDAVRAAAEHASPGDSSYVLTYVDLIQAEMTRQNPEVNMLRGSTERLKEIASKAGSTALTTAVTALVQLIARSFGG